MDGRCPPSGGCTEPGLQADSKRGSTRQELVDGRQQAPGLVRCAAAERSLRQGETYLIPEA